MKTTAKDFKAFQKCCRNWQDRFNLRQYALTFLHNNDHPEAEAWVIADLESGNAVIGFSDDWEEKPTQERLNLAALHEMLELLLWEARTLMSAVFCNEVINRKVHNIIRPLESFISSGE